MGTGTRFPLEPPPSELHPRWLELIDENQRLQRLVAELLKKNQQLREHLTTATTLRDPSSALSLR